jgi:hypothetical protein
LTPEREASFEDFVKEVYVSEITEAGMVSWSDKPLDLSLYGLRLTNEDIITDGAFFDSFLSCDAILHTKLPKREMEKVKEQCRIAWKYGISAIEKERAEEQLIFLYDALLEGETGNTDLIIDIFDEELPAFEGGHFLEDWKSYLSRKESDKQIAGLLGERLDILISASYRAGQEEDEDEEYEDYPVVLTEEEKTLTPEIRVSISQYFDPKIPLPPELEIRDHPRMGRGVYAKAPLGEEWRSRIGGTVYFTTAEKLKKMREDGAEFLIEVRGRFAPGDIERTVWVDEREHWSGLINHAWDSPISFEEHPCPKAFANMEVNEEGQIMSLRTIDPEEQLLWDYGIEYWMKSDKAPIWDVRDITPDCLKNPALKKGIVAYLEISEMQPQKAFLFRIQEEAREEEEEEEEEPFELTSNDVNRVLARRLTQRQISKTDTILLKTLDSILDEENINLLSKLNQKQFVKIVDKIMEARKRGALGEEEDIPTAKLKKLVDELITKERKKKKTESFPFSPEGEIESYERAVLSHFGRIPETNVANTALSGKEEERIVSAPIQEATVDSRNELKTISRRMGVLWTWYKTFAERLTATLPEISTESATALLGKERIPMSLIAERNDHFVLLAAGKAFFDILDSMRDRIYVTEDELKTRKALEESLAETTNYLWSAFGSTGIDVDEQAYWKPTSDAAQIRAGEKLLFFLGELSNTLESTAKFVTEQEPIVPDITEQDSAWAHGRTEGPSPRKPGQFPRKILVSARTKRKRLLAERGVEMLEHTREKNKCPGPIDRPRPRELPPKTVLDLADTLANEGVDNLYDFDVQCGLLVYALASRYGITTRIGCYDIDLYSYHNTVSDFLVELGLLEIIPDAEITGGVYKPDYENMTHLFLRKFPKEKTERWKQSVKNAMEMLTPDMTIISLEERKKLEEEGFDLGERVRFFFSSGNFFF